MRKKEFYGGYLEHRGHVLVGIKLFQVNKDQITSLVGRKSISRSKS